MLSVKDYDFLGMNNQYIGESWLHFNEISKSSGDIETQSQTHLELFRPSNLSEFQFVKFFHLFRNLVKSKWRSSLVKFNFHWLICFPNFRHRSHQSLRVPPGGRQTSQGFHKEVEIKGRGGDLAQKKYPIVIKSFIIKGNYFIHCFNTYYTFCGLYNRNHFV